MNRKEFLHLSFLATIASLFSAPFAAKPLFAEPFSPVPEHSDTGYDAIVVGTGYGGAVAALRLTEAGKKVLMLEMGMDWNASGLSFSKMAWATKESTWLKTRTIAPFGNFRTLPKFTGVLDRMDFDHIKVYAGRGVGGGSLANGGMAVTPKKAYFKEMFPELDTEDFYAKYFPLANQELGTEMIPDQQYRTSKYYEFSRVGEAEAHKAGFKTFRVPNIYDFDYMRKEEAGEVPKSALAGEVIYGNNHGKRDLTKTYLKKAKATGNLTILSLHQVETVQETGKGNYRLLVKQIDTKGKTVQEKTFRTSHLFLSAGSLGTTGLLLKSKALGDLPRLDRQVGLYWGNNGNCMLGRNFVKGGTGTHQSTIPAAGVDNWHDPEHCFFTEIAPLPLGMETYAGLYLSINRVPKYGQVIYDLKKDKLELVWDASHTQHMVANARFFVDKMNQANGGTYARLLFDRGIGVDICYHPLGGAVLGKATDLHGRVNGHPGLYVMDGALIPGSIGVNPFVTITALAEYCMEDIVAKDFA